MAPLARLPRLSLLPHQCSIDGQYFKGWFYKAIPADIPLCPIHQHISTGKTPQSRRLSFSQAIQATAGAKRKAALLCSSKGTQPETHCIGSTTGLLRLILDANWVQYWETKRTCHFSGIIHFPDYKLYHIVWSAEVAISWTHNQDESSGLDRWNLPFLIKSAASGSNPNHHFEVAVGSKNSSRMYIHLYSWYDICHVPIVSAKIFIIH